MVTIVGILRDAKAFLKNPDNWTKGSYEHNGKCCAVGAVSKFASVDVWDKELKAEELLNEAARSLGHTCAIELNDDPKTTHRKVIQMFNKAIKRAER